MKKQQFWKLLTHDFRSPIRVGEPIFDGKTFPFRLNGVILDKGNQECAPGWNFVDSIESGFKIVGMWPTGRPSAVLSVHPSRDKIQRGNKWRSSKLTIDRFAATDEINAAIERFSQVFKGCEKEMSREQILWREALGRPLRDINKVAESLEIALKKRGLDWKLKEYPAARAARAARAAWAAWDAWAARDTWAARAARDALTVNFASFNKWITHPVDLLTAGIRDAYLNGLEIALPTDKDTLGFSINP